MSARPEPRSPRDVPADALQGWLTLVPALALAWPGPGALLVDVPTTVSAAAGWTALLTLPAALALALRRVEVRLSGSTLLLAVLVVAAIGAGRAGDPFEARRSFTSLVSALVLTLSGASLGDRGRRVLARGFALATLAWVVFAGLDRAGAHTGVLGNTGDLSEAALPGALLGLWVFASTAGPWRVVGAAAAATYGIYAGALPVIAGGLALVLASLACAGASLRNQAVGRLARLALLASVVVLAAYGGRELVADGGRAGDPAPAADATPAAGELGGVEFRLRTWRRLPNLFLDRWSHWALGVGPGQFERTYPPYRDPLELELSSHGRAEPTPVEVEHAHNDWLEGPLELGAVGGLAWILFLLWGLARSGRALLGPDPLAAALGAAAIAALVNAGANSPLLHGVAAPAVIWPILGAVMGRGPESGGSASAPPRRAARLLAPLAGLLLLGRAGAALAFVRHGDALARVAHTTLLYGDELEGLRAGEVGPLLAEALEACPDSALALEKRHELLAARGASAADRIANLERLLALRPHRFGALLNLGAVLAGEGRFAQAGEAFEHAGELDPTHPALLRNRLRLAIDTGDQDQFLASSARLRVDGIVDDAWLERTAAELLLSGRPGIAAAMLAQLDPTLVVTDPESSYVLARRLDDEGDRPLLADGARANAHFLWARGHVAQGAPGQAAVSYRQALRIARGYPGLPGGAALVKLEMAAAQLLDQHPDDARETLEGVTAAPVHWRLLPAWAGQALMDGGLLR